MSGGREIVRYESRFSYWKRKVSETSVGKRLNTFWADYLCYYGIKTWGVTKTMIWVASTGAILTLLPLGIEATIEGESQAM
jgi:hypothetical protein